MNDDKPLVSIGMPVYNGEKYIRDALDSLLAQDYENFELIISDNASTDGTGEICREYAVKDKRIQYYRNEKNMGAAWNFNRVLELASGKYFMWAADHDIWDRTFISQCMKVLRDEPSVVLCYSQTRYIDLDGNLLGTATDYLDTRLAPDLLQRFHLIIWKTQRCDSMYGLMRADALRKAQLLPPLLRIDHLVLADMSLQGTFAQIPSTLFYMRKIRPNELGKEAVQRRLKTIAPNLNGNFQNSLLMFRHLKLVKNASVSVSYKMRLTIDVLRCFVKRYKVLTEIRRAVFAMGIAKLHHATCLLRGLRNSSNDVQQ